MPAFSEGADTSNSLFHATFAFATSIPFLRFSGLPVEMAFASAVISILIDLDASISPSKKYERAFHSAWSFLFTIALPFTASMLSFDPSIASIPAIALLAHLFQDVISGEFEFHDDRIGNIGTARAFMPRVSKVLDISSLPAALAMLLL